MLNELIIKKDKEYCTLVINGMEIKSAKNVAHLLTLALNVGTMREFKGDIILNYSREKSINETNFKEYTKEQFLIDEKGKREDREKKGILRYDTDWFYWLKENRKLDFDIEGFESRWVKDDSKPFFIDFKHDNKNYRLGLGSWIVVDLEDINNMYLVYVTEEN